MKTNTIFKRAACLVLVFALVFVFGGCETTGSAETDPSPPPDVLTETQENISAPNASDSDATETTATEPSKPEGDNSTSGSPAPKPETPTNNSSGTSNETPHNHSYSAASTVSPSCGKKGYTLYKCSCGDSYKDNYTSALSHNYSSEVVEPTQNEKGYTHHSCTNCGHSYKDDYTDSLEDQAQARPSYKAPDEKELADAVIKYINEYRSQEGTVKAEKLPGLTKIAQDRADQLVTDFRHNDHALRELCNNYQYGEYVDATEFGADACDSYYTFGGTEAIGKGPVRDSADNLGKAIATGFFESKGHWRGIGARENVYIAVGMTYDEARQTFYCCVLLCAENYG